MRQLREILRLRGSGSLSQRAIARSLGISVGSVCTCVLRAERAGLSWPLPEGLDDEELARRLHPRAEAGAASRPRPDWASVHQELRRPGVTLLLLWIEHLEAHPGGYRYSQFCERYRRWARALNPTMRQRHRAGEKTFVDFSGKKPEVVDPRSGEVRQVELFVGVLGASSYVYAEACESQELVHWIAAHVRMLDFFGGSSRIWVPDNLKDAITRPCRYEATAHRTYEELAEHYGAVVIPARVRRPRDKAKVEAAVLLVQRWILARLRNRTFFGLAELNQAITELLADLNRRPMKVVGVSRRALFEELDRPALLSLPPTRYEMFTWTRSRTVNIDYHVEVEKNYYSVPYTLIHQTVEARFTATTVELFHQSRRIASHARLTGRGHHATLPEHMPASHRAHAEWTPSRILRWAAQTGPFARALANQILDERRHPEQGFRSCLGLLRLEKPYGADRLEAACERALALRSPRYQTVKNILITERDRLPLPVDEPAAVLPEHENVRGATFYTQQEIEC